MGGYAKRGSDHAHSLLLSPDWVTQSGGQKERKPRGVCSLGVRDLPPFWATFSWPFAAAPRNNYIRAVGPAGSALHPRQMTRPAVLLPVFWFFRGEDRGRQPSCESSRRAKEPSTSHCPERIPGQEEFVEKEAGSLLETLRSEWAGVLAAYLQGTIKVFCFCPFWPRPPCSCPPKRVRNERAEPGRGGSPEMVLTAWTQGGAYRARLRQLHPDVDELVL